MRKKRSNKLNVSQLFVLKQKESTETKIFQKCNNSFSQVVSGVNPDSSEYQNIWPELSNDAKSKTKISNTVDLNVAQIVNKIKKIEIQDIKQTEAETSSLIEKCSNFPNLEESSKSVMKRKKIKSLSLSDPVQSVLSKDCDTNIRKKSRGKTVNSGQSLVNSSQNLNSNAAEFLHTPPSFEASTLVKTRHFGKGKVKRNDPISFNLEAAIEVSKLRQKKELKRLHKKPVLTTVTCGNALDSTNPVRKKGKVRLNKKKKVTSLRRCIERLKLVPKDERDIQSSLCKVHDGINLTNRDMDKIKIAKLHNSKFREYCRNFASKELVEVVKDLVMTLRIYQDRSFKNNEIKARQRRRFAVGFHECLKLLRANSFKFVVIATNIERNEALFEKIKEFEVESGRQGIPVIYAGTCTDLSYWLFKKNRTCVVGVINYDGANELYSKMMRIYEREKACYEVKLNQILFDSSEPMSTDTENVEEAIRSNMIDKLLNKPLITPSKLHLS